MTAKVSVVICFYNGANFIREAIASVYAQTLADWELVLVDDGSSDESSAIARDLAAKDSKVRYVSHPGHARRGLAQSRVLGSDAATGEYLLFLDHDDLIYEDNLERLAGLLDAYPRAAVVLAATRFWHWDYAQSDTRIQTFAPLRSGMTSGRRFLLYLLTVKDGHPHVCSTMYRLAEFIRARDTAPTWHGTYEDTALIIKVLASHDVFVLDEAVSDYRIHKVSRSHTAGRDFGAFLRWVAREIPLDPASRALVRCRWIGYELRRRLSLNRPRRASGDHQRD